MDELDDLLNAEDDIPVTAPAPASDDNQKGSDKSGDTEDDEPMADQPEAPQHESQPEAPSSPAAEAETIDPQLALRDHRSQQCIQLMSERQLDRYAAFRRSKLEKRNIRRLVATATGKVMNGDALIIMAGVSKMHIGEVVEKARELAEKRGNYGPLLPQDIRAAFAEVTVSKSHKAKQRRRF